MYNVKDLNLIGIITAIKLKIINCKKDESRDKAEKEREKFFYIIYVYSIYIVSFKFNQFYQG